MVSVKVRKALILDEPMINIDVYGETIDDNQTLLITETEAKKLRDVLCVMVGMPAKKAKKKKVQT